MEDRNRLENSIEDLKRNVREIRDQHDYKASDLFPNSNDLPGLNFDIEIYDYERDIEIIRDEAQETLDCISSLYLTDDTMMNKNISKLIKNDAEEISDIKFSLSCAKRGLINCMRQLDSGINDPEMHTAVNSYQKEIRESNKMIHDLLNKMKIFYKDLREELKTDEDINLGLKKDDNDEDLKLVDKKEMNKIIESYKKDPTLIK